MKAVAVAKASAGVAERVHALLSRKMHTDEWRVDGEIVPVREVEPGRWLVRVPRENPLRLKSVHDFRRVAVYAEMETDWASVPACAQRLGDLFPALHLHPRDFEHAVFGHDMDYEAGACWCVWRRRAVWVPLTKRQADAKLFVMLECAGATWADGLAYHGGVSLGGRAAWRKCRRNKADWPLLFGGETNGMVQDG